MIVRLRELRSNEAICRYDNIKKKEDDPMSSLKDKTVTMAHGAGGRHRHRNERQHAELHHHHLKHHQRI